MPPLTTENEEELDLNVTHVCCPMARTPGTAARNDAKAARAALWRSIEKSQRNHLQDIVRSLYVPIAIS